MHLLVRNGVKETNLCGVEHQSLSGLTIQSIPYNRSVQSFGMSGMDAELVSATGERKEIHEQSAIGSAFADMIARDSGFAVLTIYHLPRSIIGIRQERQINHSIICIIRTLKRSVTIRTKHRFLPFEDISALEITLQGRIDIRRFSEDKQSGSVLIQTMHGLGV